MKVSMSPDVRAVRTKNHYLLEQINREIHRRVSSEYAEEIKAYKEANDLSFQQEKDFKEQAFSFLRTLDTTQALVVEIQWGKDGLTINRYVGHLEKPLKYGSTTFNFISPEAFDGKPFTIGASCLLSVELLSNNLKENKDVKSQ